MLLVGRATGGSTTTIIHADRPAADKADEEYAGGFAVVLRDFAGAGAAPEGQLARITSYASSTFTFTLADTLTAAVASGDRYGVVVNQFSLDEAIDLANDALQMFDIPLVNSSISVSENQTEYELPVALKANDLLRVRYQTDPNDSNDNRWVDVYDWEVRPSAAGSVATLILPQLTAGRTVELWYKGKHPTVNAFDDDIAEIIDPMLARAAMVERIRSKQTEAALSAAPPLRRSYDKARAELDEAVMRYPIYIPQKRSKLMKV